MKKAIAWLKKWGWAVLVGIAAVAGMFLGGAFVRQLRRPDKLVKRELKAIDAGAETAAKAVEEGADVAVAALKDQHKKTIEGFNDAQKDKLARLERDPAAAAKWLTRLSE